MRQRYSAQREAIYDMLMCTDAHPTAETVFDAVRKSMPDISLGTVYRNLAEIVEEGGAVRLDMGDGKIRFDAATEQHAHFCCKQCGRVSDVGYSSLPTDGIELKGYGVDGYSLHFFGTCPDCGTKK